MRTSILLGFGLALAAAPLASHSARAATAAAPSEQDAAAQRIQALQNALHITPEQTPQWNTFATAMRDNATATDALFRDRAAGAASMNAADNMKSYASVAHAYADNTQKLSDAFQALYASLSDAQKQTADALFRQQAQKQATRHK